MTSRTGSRFRSAGAVRPPSSDFDRGTRPPEPRGHSRRPVADVADVEMGLQRLDRLRIEEERLKSQEGDAVVVHVRRTVEVGIDDDPPEPVVEM